MKPEESFVHAQSSEVAVQENECDSYALLFDFDGDRSRIAACTMSYTLTHAKCRYPVCNVKIMYIW